MVPFLRFLGKALWIAALAAIVVGVGMIIANGGTWPDTLAPVQNLFQTLHGALGPFAWIVQVALFAGPGTLFMWFADYLEDRPKWKQPPRNSN